MKTEQEKNIDKALFNYRDRLLEAQLLNDGVITITHITTCFAETKKWLEEKGIIRVTDCE